jgi:ferric-dicitrate binding protein FerR (iron transport regulator)
MSHDDSEPHRRETAAQWAVRLGASDISTGELQAFSAWRRDPQNQRAWEAFEASQEPVERFVVRPEAARFRVIDIWTGQTAVIAMTPQDGLSEEDAVHTAALLNRRAKGGDRTILQ